jgi:exopolyphosphatase/guanosine-5'-triphosphate,3'-diphosphate pyrophosphatase
VNRAYAAIDLGSNSLLLAVESADGTLLHDQAEVVGLGKGLGDMGQFEPARMAHAEQVLRHYVQVADSHGIPPQQIRICATSGARRASNAPQFFDQMKRELGIKIQTISGEEEAQLSYLGALRGLELEEGPVLVIDLGGGSTEIIIGQGELISYRTSLEVGAVRLTEAFGLDQDSSGLPDALSHLQDLLAAVVLPAKPSQAVVVAGTATTLAAMDAGLSTYQGKAVHGRLLTRERLNHWQHRLLQADAGQRKTLASVSPKRADYLAGGAAVIATVLHFCGLEACIASDAGLRFGILKAARAAE